MKIFFTRNFQKKYVQTGLNSLLIGTKLVANDI